MDCVPHQTRQRRRAAPVRELFGWVVAFTERQAYGQISFVDFFFILFCEFCELVLPTTSRKVLPLQPHTGRFVSACWCARVVVWCAWRGREDREESTSLFCSALLYSAPLSLNLLSRIFVMDMPRSEQRWVSPRFSLKSLSRALSLSLSLPAKKCLSLPSRFPISVALVCASGLRFSDVSNLQTPNSNPTALPLCVA